MTKQPEKHRKYVLERIIREYNFTMGAELGVQKGITHQYLLDVFPKLTLIGVDINALQAAAIAGGGAALVVVKEYAKKQISK